MTDKKWLSLKEAAAILEIHPTTLRRWADSGSVPVMTTPGGHRRFNPADLATVSQKKESARRKGDVQQDWADSAIEQTRKGIDKRPNVGWMLQQNEETRLEYRQLGQRLVGLTMQYIALDEGGEYILDEAREIGYAYAQAGLAIDMGLTDALRASMFFHDQLLETSLQLPETARFRPEANRRILRRINTLLNTVHLSIASAYERNM